MNCPHVIPGRGGHDTGLRDYIGIFMRMLGDDRLENIEESMVFFQGGRCRRYVGSGPNAQLRCGWIGWEE